MKSIQPVYLVVLGALALAGGDVLSAEVPAPRSKPKLAFVIQPRDLADDLHAVVGADREVYTRLMANRLPKEPPLRPLPVPREDTASPPAPCRMVRLCDEAAQTRGAEFSYVLRALAPSNPQNAPETDVERKGLEWVTARPQTNYYSEEMLGGRRYFTAVYPDMANQQACLDCHATRLDGTGRPAKLGDVLGALVVRVPLEF